MSDKPSYKELEEQVHRLQQRLKERDQEIEKLQLLSAITENMSESVVATNAGFEITYLNKKAEELFGYTIEEVRGLNPDIFNAEPTADEIQKELYEIVSSGEVFVGEHVNKRKDGTTFLCEFKVFPLIGSNRKTYAYVGIQKDVTAQRRQKDKLHMQSLVLDQTHDHVTITDLNGVISFVNRAQRIFFQKTKESIIGQTTRVFGEDPDRGATQKEILEHTLKHGTWRGEVINYDNEGKEHIMDCRTQVVNNELGKPIALCGIATDITGYKQAEKALRESEAKCRLIVQSIPQKIFIKNMEGIYISCNELFAKDMGINPGEITGKTDDDFFPKELAEKYRSDDLRIISSGKQETIEERYEKDGKTAWVRTHKAPVYDSEGRITGTLGAFSDITDQKAAEEALKESEEKFRSLVEQAAEMLFLHDLKGNLIDVNLAAVNNTGYSREELQGMTVFDIDPDARNRKDMRDYWQSLKAGAPHFTLEGRHRRKDGSTYPAEIVGSKIVFKNVPYILGLARDITERKKAEETIRKSEEKHRRILKTAMDGFWIVDTKGRLKEVNDAYCQMSGYSEQELLAMSIWDLEANEDSNVVAEHSQKIIHEGQDRFETIHRRKDGTCFDVEVRVQYSDMDGGRHIAFLRDITDRKQTETALRENEALFRSLVDGAPEGIFVQSKGRFLFLNSTMVRMFGADSAEEIIGTEIMARMAPEYHEVIRARIRFQRETGQPAPALDEEYLRLDGSRFPVEAAAVTIRFLGDDAHLVFVRDIAKRKKMEKDLADVNEKFYKAFHASPLIMSITTLDDGSFIDVNESFLNLLGFSREEIIGKTSSEVGLWRQTNRQEIMDEIIRNGFVHHKEIIITTKNEEEIPILWFGEIANISQEQCVIASGIDLRLQKKLESRLQQAQKMESLGTLAGGIAHDFNNLLSPIIGMSEMLIEDLPFDSPEQENVRMIYKSGIRGSDLVKQILAFSRQTKHKMIPTRIQHILKDALNLSRATIPSYIEIESGIQPDCGLVMADPSQLHQVAMNIITNAYHAVEAKGGKISVRLTDQVLDHSDVSGTNLKPGQYAKLSISDTGTGIEADVLPKIFDPYFTTKAQGKGTGLGLAVVYGIIQEHKGEITVESQAGNGTTFNLYLPLIGKQVAEPPPAPAEEHQKGQERILLVDDEATVIEMTKLMLERIGYSVTARLNSIEALELFKARPYTFDLVISDMSMPYLIGTQLAEKILSVRPDIPIIICTGFSEKIDEKKAKEIGINGFIMKPVLKIDLAKKIRAVLDKRYS